MDKLGQIGDMGRAYGAGLASGKFDPLTFVKKPQVILRIVSLIFAIIVFGCISSGGTYYDDSGSHCVYNDSGSNCGWGIFIGVAAFLACIILLVVDSQFDSMSSVGTRKRAVISDLASSAAFVFLLFITFCVLVNQWAAATVPEDVDPNPPQAAIAFCFFSVFTWGGILFFAFRRYQEGSANAFAPSYEQDFAPNDAAPGFGYPGGPTHGTNPTRNHLLALGVMQATTNNRLTEPTPPPHPTPPPFIHNLHRLLTSLQTYGSRTCA